MFQTLIQLLNTYIKHLPIQALNSEAIWNLNSFMSVSMEKAAGFHVLLAIMT